jgi:hypothetical protein
MRIHKIAVITFLLCLSFSPAFAGRIPTYTGRVVDSQNGKPIDGASVLIYWEKGIPGFMHANSEPIKAVLVETDQTGSYSVDGFIAYLGLTAWLDYTQIIIYCPGYQAYISRIWEQDRSANNGEDFKISDNLVRLQRIPPDFDHGKHFEKIEDALRGLDLYLSQPENSSWSDIKKMALIGFPERQSLLRKADWEQERSRRDYGQ